MRAATRVSCPSRGVLPNSPSALPNSACNRERFAGNPRRIGRREIHGGGRDVLRLADPAQRHFQFMLGAEVALRNTSRMQTFGFGHARTDRVDAYPARPQL